MTAKPFGWRPEKVVTEEAVIVPWPEPEVRARPATDEEIPRGAKPMVKLAEANGWEYRVRYARGTLPIGGLQWNPGHVVDGVALFARRGDFHLVAAWFEGKFDCCWVASANRKDITKVNSTDLRRVLAGELE